MYVIKFENKNIEISLLSEDSAFKDIKAAYTELCDYNLKACKNASIDITAIGYIDSSMLGQIMKLNDKCKEFKINFTVVCKDEQSKVLHLCSLHKMFSVVLG